MEGPRLSVLSSKSIQPSDLWSFHFLDGGHLYPETFDVVHPMSSPLNPPKLQFQGLMEQFEIEGNLKTYFLQFSPPEKFSPFKSCPWLYPGALWMLLQGFCQPDFKPVLADQVWSQTKAISGTHLRKGQGLIKLLRTLLLPSSRFMS